MAKILVVDDDAAILDLVGNVLNKDGHFVTKVSNPLKINMEKVTNYDLILLDIMMPGIDGFSLCLKIRELVDCPILFLTAKTEESSLVNGLSLGADDYICKPFGVMELRARIAAHLRREHREHSVRMVLGRVCFHLSLKQMTVDNKEIPLTKTEYEICEFLARNCGQIFSKEQILEQVFGFDSESNDNTITTHIKNIRLKFSDYNCMPIKTVWGIGYKWEKEEH
ncbi:response regulator transcription factor [Roseburia sp. 1XD42-69]|jgi:DNA-binding response OmpR family regulator|uniref:response regulator transcription factor n=1 Tax=Roseburia sp. 1XD42-69 TaxID=2320088 RepID=UPI000EA28D79|nr:response regulator transcription factor [Roseburia sp. 1XD42-69]MCX4318890.1 response regulator transcription factor [Lachnospiraceae bacterium]RKJ65923.1 DNA-binding response regulator [Roseburia sp. 1XD42-69]